MKLIYQLILLWLTLNLTVYLFREKRLSWQLSAGMVLILFILRLLLIK